MTDDLPSGWALARLPDLIGPGGVFSDGDWVESEDQDPSGDVRLIQLADVGDGVYVDKSSRFLTKPKAHQLNCTFLRAGDVLVARMPDPLGRACIFPGDQREAVTVVDVCVLRGEQDHIDQRWLMHFINSPELRSEINALQSGSTRKRISRGNLATIQFRVPPRAEQSRIVDKVEELLSNLNAGVAELKIAQRKLAQYYQSLLQAAVRGELTADWRAARGAPKETGAELLHRILSGRRARWEAKQRAKFSEQGRTPPKGWQAKYPEPTPPDSTSLPVLPDGWVWAGFDQVFDALSDGGRKLPQSNYAKSGRYPVVDQGAKFFGGYTDDASLLFGGRLPVLVFGDHTRRFKLVSTPFVVGADGAKLIGLSAAWNPQYAFMACEALVFEDRGYSRHFQFVRGSAFPLPPLDEQEEIAARFGRQLDSQRDLFGVVARALDEAAAQRKNLLRAAFNGHLTRQDPDDEAASRLLARIRAARAGNSSSPRRSQRKTS